MDSTAIIDLKQFITGEINGLREEFDEFRIEMRDEFRGVHQRLTYTHGEITDLSGEVGDLRREMMSRFDEVYEFVGDMFVNHDERISVLEKRRLGHA